MTVAARGIRLGRGGPCGRPHILWRGAGGGKPRPYDSMQSRGERS
jgi:hypothetical protein